ncbi:hypothetical protein HF521_014129 [Silurus meridionalis]|uniref:Uncharacterized protein n=1 Tax=Silurus meridionalis TaxID=175797 RepID=A0A8T0A844_SILME|nr:hypothetical protein HF521_014129 [Silurus meridionalis]
MSSLLLSQFNLMLELTFQLQWREFLRVNLSFLWLSTTFNPDEMVPDSKYCVNRTDVFSVDCLYHKDHKLLRCLRNDDAIRAVKIHLGADDSFEITSNRRTWTAMEIAVIILLIVVVFVVGISVGFGQDHKLLRCLRNDDAIRAVKIHLGADDSFEITSNRRTWTAMEIAVIILLIVVVFVVGISVGFGQADSLRIE